MQVRRRRDARDGHSNLCISFVVPTFFMHQITGTKRDTVPYHRHIQDGIAAKRVDQLIVQKKFPNVVCIVTNVLILADQ